MKSPFPGMDPFLEEPSEWGDVHSRLITTIGEYLGDALAPDFFARIEQRVYITEPDGSDQQQLIPDLAILTGRNPRAAAGNVGVLTEPTMITMWFEPEVHERFIEVRAVQSREVVAIIEIVSPSNKTRGLQTYDAFQQKRDLVSASVVHWVEIDLLRAGERPTTVAGKSDYCALLKRGNERIQMSAWYFDLRDALPTIAVPLRPPFPDVPLNLQAVFDTMYARAHYADSVDYQRPFPAPRLRPADAIWAAHRVQAWNAARQQA